MTVQTFIADSASDAIRQIRTQLGPQAVVLHVRQVPADGLSRLWQKPRIEVLATAGTPPVPEALAELRRDLTELRQAIAAHPPAMVAIPAAAHPVPPENLRPAGGGLAKYLEQNGLLPQWAQHLETQLQPASGQPSPIPSEAIAARIGSFFRRAWRPATPPDWSRPQVLIGPAGSGKTTCLCKWLTQTVLLAGRPARVWRLDGDTANTAETLSIYGDILGVAVERLWPQPGAPEIQAALAQGEAVFVDLPGVAWNRADAVAGLKRRLEALGPCEARLVLNAAYETPWLQAQAQALAPLAEGRLVLTHLDEEPRRGKWWNLLLGTNYTLGFLSAGQNIPGDFAEATLERLMEGLFSR